MVDRKPRPPLIDVYPIFFKEIHVYNIIHIKLAVLYEIYSEFMAGPVLTCENKKMKKRPVEKEGENLLGKIVAPMQIPVCHVSIADGRTEGRRDR